MPILDETEYPASGHLATLAIQESEDSRMGFGKILSSSHGPCTLAAAIDCPCLRYTNRRRTRVPTNGSI
jgi:hypothetical protein